MLFSSEVLGLLGIEYLALSAWFSYTRSSSEGKNVYRVEVSASRRRKDTEVGKNAGNGSPAHYSQLLYLP